MNFFRTKIASHSTEKGDLLRCLSAFDLTLLGIGAIIGAGIFVLTGIAAATKAGPAVTLSYGVAGLACLFAALSYAELAASIKGTGSAYSYAYAGLGEIVAWIMGWTLILEYGVGACAIGIGWSGYVNDMLLSFGVAIPTRFLKSYLEGGILNLPAASIILLLSGVLALGAKESARLNTIIVFIKLTVIAIFIATAFTDIKPSNWQPFMPFGWDGVVQGAALVFFAFIGFDAVSTAAEEAKNPQKDLALATIGSLGFCTIVYIIVAGLLTAIVSYTTLNTDSPVADAILSLGHKTAGEIISIGAVAGLTSGVLIFMFGLSRILYAMATDGLLPGALAKVNVSTKTPVRLILISGFFLALIAGFCPMKEVAEIVNIGTLAAFVIVSSSVIVLRSTKPHLPRPFKTPFYPLIPLLGIISCSYLMLNLPMITWQRFLVWIIIGLFIYFLYGYRHSRLA